MKNVSKTIYPTLTCFDDALELMHDILKFAQGWAPEDRTHLLLNLYLVHAIVKASDRETAHAWVEHDGYDQVFIVGLIEENRVAFTGPRKDYYRVHNVIDKFRYTYSEAVQENRRTGTYGPWIPELDALCGNGVEVTMLEPIPLIRISQ